VRWNQLADNVWHIYQPIFESEAICPEYRVWPWNGHRLFAYDLISFLNPRLFVELGTYWGTSFFSFCQAVKDFELQTRCVAIDTWEGDDHTGKYDNEVFQKVNEISSSLFAETDISLMRSYFKDALADFADGSIDLLHIDGLHTYEAAREDFTSWLPKLAENGIVLFHDIADSCDYGSVRYWKELLESYPGFSFQHSWGLGVLFPKGDHYLELMKKNNLSDKMKIYEYCSELNLMRIQKEDGEQWGYRQDALIKFQEKQIAELQLKVDQLGKDINRIRSSKFFKAMRMFGWNE
jgi:predicted O-methyltransferase YrrM